MSQGRPQQLGLLVVNRAFSRFAHVTGYTCVGAAFLEIVGYQSLEPSATIWPVLLPVGVTLVLLVLLDRWRTTFYSVLFLIFGGISQFWLSFVLLSHFASVRADHTLLLSLVAVSLVLVCGPGFSPGSTMVWGTVGFAVAEAAAIGAALTTGSPVHIDAIPIVVEVGLLLVEGTDAITRGRRVAVRPELERAVVDEELSVVRYRSEVRAAAIMHDTVLNHLSAIAAGVDGELTATLKAQIQRDLTVLVGEEWLGDPAPGADDQTRTDLRSSAVLTAVQEARELPMTVDLTGDLGAIDRLSTERDIAVGLAVKQCLVNVLRHAQVQRAEVAVIGSDSDVSVMVIDAGRGFSEQQVASDRLGIRQSVRRRIESVDGEVRLWSTPGRGTSVLIRVPAAPGGDAGV